MNPYEIVGWALIASGLVTPLIIFTYYAMGGDDQ